MIINNLNTLVVVHTTMQRCGLVNSKADFSVRFLEKGASYLSSMQARTRRVPDAVIAALEWSLQRELLSYSRNPHLGSEYAIRLNSAYSCLQQQLLFVRRHRASVKAWSALAPANDANPFDTPPHHASQLGP